LVNQRALDYSRVAAVHTLVADLASGRIDPAQADQRLRIVIAARHPYRRGAVTLARAALAASVAVLLGAGPIVTGAAFGATVVIDLLNAALGRGRLPAFYQNAVGGLVATAVALALVAAEVGVRPALVVAGGIVLLLPGVTLVGAVQDAITGFYVTAAARAFETFLLTAGIVAGIAVGLSIGVRLGLPVRMDDPPFTGPDTFAGQLLAATVVAASFALANYAPRRTVIVSGVAGAVGWACFVGVDRLALSPAVASAVAAVVVGLTGTVVARRQRTPALIYAVAGIIPLLPGLAIYRSMRRFAEGDSAGGLTLLGQAVAVGLALAAGTFLGEFLARPPRRARSAPERRWAELRWSGPRRRRDTRAVT
jgi:uncharacterized membrane protein YjjP (DUF1212 family)